MRTAALTSCLKDKNFHPEWSAATTAKTAAIWKNVLKDTQRLLAHTAHCNRHMVHPHHMSKHKHFHTQWLAHAAVQSSLDWTGSQHVICSRHFCAFVLKNISVSACQRSIVNVQALVTYLTKPTFFQVYRGNAASLYKLWPYNSECELLLSFSFHIIRFTLIISSNLVFHSNTKLHFI